ncbi:polysaccharide deacetylase family protein [Candidatus Omnitrophota bacterium]
MSKRVCAISVDLDPIYHYLSARGLEPIDATNINAVYDDALPRFLDIFDQYDVKATFFVVGNDSKHPKNRAMIRELANRGHEVANHTLNHNQAFYRLSPDEQRDEIQEADKILSDIIGDKIKGFRAPGWGVNAETLNILESLGYAYDSSVFASCVAPIIKLVNSLLNRGRLESSLSSNPMMGLAPKLPYRPSGDSIWKRGKAKIVELPTTILPVVQLPFLGTLLYMLGPHFFNLCFSYFNLFDRPLLYELHGIELVDYYSSINDDRLLVKPGLGKKIDSKISLYNFMLSKFSEKYSFRLMRDVASDLL